MMSRPSFHSVDGCVKAVSDQGMRRNFKIGVAGVLLVGALALMWQVLLTREPVYEGTPLHIWLAQFDLSQAERPGKVTDALRTVGTNALPLLGRMIRLKDPGWRRGIIWFNDRQSFVHFEITEASVVRYRAIGGYRALGPVAGPSVPWLIEVLDGESSVEVRADVAEALGWIGPEARSAIPALLKAANDPNPNLHRRALFAIGNIERWSPGRAEIRF